MADPESDEMLDVRSAAALAGRHPETIRRWVWSGRIPAKRHGNRLLVARDDVEALSGRMERAPISLCEWVERARRARPTMSANGVYRSAADLVIEDRVARSQAEARAGR